MWPWRLLIVAVCVTVLPSPASGQGASPSSPQAQPPTQPLTLADALAYADEHYPALKAALEQVNASGAVIDLARSAYLPRLDSLWQSNRATANNVFGQVFPQPVIPALSGPVLSASSADSVWSSATGALFSWEPADFGLRHASVTSAEAALTRARAGEALTRLDLQAAVGNAFLILMAAERSVVVAQADLDRRTLLKQAIQTLVDNQLRPGADASRADAERAAATTRLIQAQQSVTLARITLGRLLGGVAVTAVDDGRFVAATPAADLPSGAATHPAIQLHDAAVEQARNAQSVLAKTDYPRLYLLASAFARGSGATTTGPFDGGPGGLKLDRFNWAVGFQVMFPNVFDFSSLGARKATAAALTRAEVALDDEAKLMVTSQQESAAALLQSARAVATNTPLQLAAARQSEAQARARYDAGLANITEIADAQGALSQAEAQDEVARVDVWRALLATAAAQGDLMPFVALIRQP
jgi:outer membrane protein TolC